MSITSNWIAENVLLEVVMKNEITVGEIEDLNTQLIALKDGMPEGIPLMHVMLDCVEVTSFPSKLNDLLGIKGTRESLKHPRTGWIVMISDKSLVLFLMSMVAKISGVRFTSFVTRAQALDHFKKMHSIAHYLAHVQL